MSIRRRAALVSLVTSGAPSAGAAVALGTDVEALDHSTAGDLVRLMHLLRRGGGSGEIDDPGIADKDRASTGGPRIRCPKCAWEPRREDTWACACLHAWNTFETGGVCPACQRQWLETQCPRCDAWSPHLAWYVDDDASNSH